MFKRTTDRTFQAEVKVPVANAAGGYDANTFKATFEHANSDELDELRVVTNRELIARKLKNWDLVDEETKEQVPFTPENLAALLAIPPTPTQIVVAFWETINGARAKNF
ncbi:hypothetical protein [Aquabacterium sp.]|uniref:hypothetical protein n=1 Tax=Aquabacterium sp. TaxID=1872578 RepID=UPI0025C21BD8|nr:hypothetical protein [Aquabacterium sp.]